MGIRKDGKCRLRQHYENVSESYALATLGGGAHAHILLRIGFGVVELIAFEFVISTISSFEISLTVSWFIYLLLVLFIPFNNQQKVCKFDRAVFDVKIKAIRNSRYDECDQRQQQPVKVNKSHESKIN